MKTVLAFFLFVLAFLSPCIHAQAQTSQTGQPGSVGLPNPASVFCTQCGGNVLTVETAQGQTGWCVFPGGFIIDEWDFWRLFAPQTSQSP